ncbi:MAG: HAD family phosphatase [Flavobacteriales bacterium]|nr:HAD family phosphatase [Flavobacteriales bacterium]
MSRLDLSQLDTVILDLGGVLIDVDYGRTAQAFAALGVQDFDALYAKARQHQLFDDFERGTLTPADFRQRLRDITGTTLTDAQIDSGWNAMLGTISPAHMVLVEELRMRYRVFLLSNTNAIHVPAFQTIIRRDFGITDFKQEFDAAYYSCEIGLRKPDAAIFQHVMKEQHALPGRTLFIDDSPQHVEGARAVGLHAEHLDLAREDLSALVERLGLLV